MSYEQNFIYRTANPNEQEQLHELKVAAFSPYASLLTDEHRETLFSSLHNREATYRLITIATVFVCEDAGKLVGMAFFLPSGNPNSMFDAGWAQIRLVSVLPEYKGRGIARKLTEMCIQHARATGEHILALHTAEFMNTARRIYEGFGFSVYKEIPRVYGKRYWVYTLQLQPASEQLRDFDFNEHIVLENDRVKLLPLDNGHMDALKGIINRDVSLMKYSYPSVTNDAELGAYVERALQWRADGLRYPFTIVDKQSGKVAGSTSYAFVDNINKRLEIGFTWISYDYQSTGLNDNMKYLMLQYAFDALGFQRVEFRADSRNMQSRTAIAKLGATFEGELRSFSTKQNGLRVGAVVYSILAEEWPAIKERLQTLISTKVQ